MDIPNAFRWVLLALAVLQLLSFVSVLRRLRQSPPERRLDHRLDVLDSVSGILLLAGLGLANIPLGIVGLALMGIALLLKGLRLLRSRRAA
ncbi:hypothetical protein ABTY59_15030 [Streptomyces sp. NPDC096079]|uniref:hypothetical protein n=1 Tax=unclassified Streptomyces TaxID=2593676 RepID=UPI003328DD09